MLSHDHVLCRAYLEDLAFRVTLDQEDFLDNQDLKVLKENQHLPVQEQRGRKANLALVVLTEGLAFQVFLDR